MNDYTDNNLNNKINDDINSNLNDNMSSNLNDNMSSNINNGLNNDISENLNNDKNSDLNYEDFNDGLKNYLETDSGEFSEQPAVTQTNQENSQALNLPQVRDMDPNKNSLKNIRSSQNGYRFILPHVPFQQLNK
ncbi:4608_t:CDS:2 [Gigaspora rosea]|nr:4608_t:CDS:2 [Gigaspora rosea]